MPRTVAPVATAARPRPSTAYRVHVRSLPFAPDAEQAYRELFAAGPYGFWLDSSLAVEGLARFSFLGDGSGPLAEYLTYRVGDGTVTVSGRDGGGTVEQPFFDYLDERLRRRRTPVPAGLPFDFVLGYVGYLGYELKAETGGDRAHPADTPDAALLFADRMLAIDHRTGSCWLLALSAGDPGPAAGWLDDTAERLRGMRPARPRPGYPAGLLGATDRAATGFLELRHDRDSYLRKVEECLQDIRAGESYEICLTNEATARTAIDPLETFLELRRISPVPHGALLDFPGVAVLSASPERFLSVGTDGVAESRPIKGTRPRGATPVEDEVLRRDLQRGEKDRA